VYVKLPFELTVIAPLAGPLIIVAVVKILGLPSLVKKFPDIGMFEFVDALSEIKLVKQELNVTAILAVALLQELASVT
jgi:hypothetical protein